VPDDRAGEAAHDAGEQLRGRRIIGWQIRLHAKRDDIPQSCVAQNRHQPRADHRRGAGGAERTDHPAEGLVEERNGRLRSRATKVELDGDEDAVSPKIPEVVTHDRDGVRQVKENQPGGHRIERLTRVPRGDVAFEERHVALPRLRHSRPRDGQRVARAVDADDGALRTDELARDPRHMPEPGAQIEHSLAAAQARRLQNGARGPLDPRGLRVEPFELVRGAAEDVLLVCHGVTPPTMSGCSSACDRS